MSLFADDMILYVRDPKHCTEKLIALINTFNKVAVYKISIKNQYLFHIPIIA
jgi:hypothetical protein